MKKWNEIGLEMFKEVFDMYWNKYSGTEDKVLEIQNLEAIKKGVPEIRVYLGSRIMIEDFRKYNEDSLKFIEGLRKSFGPEFMKAHISLCFLTSGPKIIPIGNSKDHYNLVWNSWFGDSSGKINGVEPLKPAILWYTKNADKYILGDYNISTISRSERKIRLRGWDFDDWKDSIETYCSYGINLLGMEDDIKKEEILEP